MATLIQMSNATGEVKSAYNGFSWTCLFFGPFPAIFRCDFWGFIVMFVIGAITCGLSTLVFMFMYNGWHYNRLVKRGFRAMTGAFGGVSNQINVVMGK